MLAILVASPAVAARDSQAVLWHVPAPYCDANGCYRPSDLYSQVVAWLVAGGHSVTEWTGGIATAPLDDYGVVVIDQLSIGNLLISAGPE